MFDLLKELCEIPAPSGREDAVREWIFEKVASYGACRVDALGNLLVLKQGRKRAPVKLMLDAHMDEVGFIVTAVTEEGFLKFTTVGGIDSSVLLARRVIFLSGVAGVISAKPVHLMEGEERKKLPKTEALFIDIGASGRQDAEQYVLPGDMAVFDSSYSEFGEGLIKARAIDDRAGCAILIDLLRQEAEYDFYAAFTVQEEVGLRGARTAAFGLAPEAAIVIEATTAADIAGVAAEKQVCGLGKGPALSFMDGSTLYDKVYYDAAFAAAKEKGIPCQSKAAVAGGNNAGAIHASGEGVRTLAVSIPCRYLHSASCVSSRSDIEAAAALVWEMTVRIASGTLR